jgi:polyisoprenoid-binding protein YceI
MVSGQKYFTKTGHVSFYSDTPLEKIEAQNKSSNCVLDLATGKLEFAVLIKGFQFEKALMQEHFNENYLESNKFPKATFKGQIDNYNKIDVTKNGKSTVKVSGDLTLHGVTKKLTTEALVEVKGGKIDADATFNIIVADYNIAIPSLVKDQISKSVKVKVDATLEVLK